MVLDAQNYRAIMKVYDEVAKGSRAVEEAERSSSESRLGFEAKIEEAQKALGSVEATLLLTHRMGRSVYDAISAPPPRQRLSRQPEPFWL